MEIPLLKVLESFGGEAKPRDVYEPVAKNFSQLTAADLSARMDSTGAPKWENHVQWVRQKLVQKGEIDGSVRGVWRITPAGRARLRNAPSESAAVPPARSLVSTAADPTKTPGEVIESAHREMREALAAELLQVVLDISKGRHRNG